MKINVYVWCSQVLKRKPTKGVTFRHFRKNAQLIKLQVRKAIIFFLMTIYLSVATKSNEYSFPDRDRIDVKGTFLDQTKIREHVFSLNHDIYSWTQRAARSCVNVPPENILSPQKKSTVLLYLCSLVLWLFKIFLELNFFLGSEVHVRIDVCSFISAENKTFQIKQNQCTLGEYVKLGSTKGTRIEKCQKDPFSRIKQNKLFH